MASIEILISAWPIRDVLPLLLSDRNTKKNIIFATDSYADYGEGFCAKNQITARTLTAFGKCVIQPRILKDSAEQLLRTKKKAEVFTPAWVCCLMNNYADEEWFGRADVFGKLNGYLWTPADNPIKLPKHRRWQTYIDSRRLEITCGEAPYLASRYDMGTGEIIPIKNRIGILDRKLRIVNENTSTVEEWITWALRAFQAVYGYEYQGDSLLIARINLLLTYVDYMQDRWNRRPTAKELNEIAKAISWNIWQMDGLKGSIPMGALNEQYRQLDLFVIADENKEESKNSTLCRIFDWRGQKKSVEFNAFQKGRNGSMKFDFIIGNPPYQEETEGTSDTPIYNFFMDESYKTGDKVELITPARFLFDAGKTMKNWNSKMLNNPHFKVLKYIQDSYAIFGRNITGGIVITYYNEDEKFEPIEVFTLYKELNSILHKVTHKDGFTSIDSLIYAPESYKFTKLLHEDNPNIRYQEFDGKARGVLSKGHNFDIVSNAFKKLDGIVFFESKPEDDQDYIKIYGRKDNKRCYRWIRSKYVETHENLNKYKVVVSKSNGASGTLGDYAARLITVPHVLTPGMGHTQSFISIGKFDTLFEAQAAEKYVKSKFTRVMLGVLKATQDNKKGTWKYVPMQDFTSTSDIDWTQPIPGIDQQLYAKYGLSDEEISFIETHVEGME